VSIEHSRALLLASRISGLDERTLEQRQEESLVTVRVDPGIAGAALAGRVILTTLRRLPGRLALDRTGLPSTTVAALDSAVATIDPRRPLEVIEAPAADAKVRIQVGVAPTAGHIRVVPDGSGAQLVGDPALMPHPVHRPNALGSVVAAALAAAETFKHVVVDNEERRTIHRWLRFCPVALARHPDAARPLKAAAIDIALVGCGAIGSAVALILAELRLGGRIVLCDPERYGPENRGTYSLGGDREAREQPLKVDLSAAALEAAGYETIKVVGTSAELIKLVDAGEVAPPRIVLSGLDSVPARRETQMLFPDHLIDMATGDTAAGLHHAVPNGPCLRCFFPERAAGPDPLGELAAATGLPISRLKRGGDALTEADLAGLTPEQQLELRSLVGQPVCGLAEALGLTSTDAEGYLPSVPFVSQLAACLGVGRLLAVVSDIRHEMNFFQLDALHGPAGGGDCRRPIDDCYCQQRPAVVRQLRRRRWPGGELS
jgi:ThiF family protein